MPLKNEGAAARERSKPPIEVLSTDEPTQSPSKRKPGNVWFEDGGRYLFRSGANGCNRL